MSEDSVMGHERQAEADGGGGDPAVGVMDALPKGMTDALAVGPELCVADHQLGTGPRDIDLRQSDLQAPEAGGTPTALDGAVTNLGGRLEADDSWPAGEHREVEIVERRRPTEQSSAEDSGVDHDGATWP